MLKWLLGGSKNDPPPPPLSRPAPTAQSSSATAGVPASVPAMNPETETPPESPPEIPPDELSLVLLGKERVEPENPLEQNLSSAYRTMAQQCRQTFSAPGFDLPTLPSSAITIMNLIQNPNVAPKKITQALQFDPILTAKFLRIANSAFYRGTQEVKSVEVAIHRLGTVMVRSVVLAISLNSTIIKEKRLGDGARELWTHSINAGFAAQALAARLKLPQPTAFTLGMMHDIGKLPAWIMLNGLLNRRPGIRKEMMDTLVEDTHAEIGEVLVDVWGMPFEIKMVVGGHHLINTLEEAMQHVVRNKLDTSVAESESFAHLLGCVVLADRALAALGLAQEPGDLSISGSSLANDLGMTQKDTMDYLKQLPDLLKQNDMRDL